MNSKAIGQGTCAKIRPRLKAAGILTSVASLILLYSPSISSNAFAFATSANTRFVPPGVLPLPFDSRHCDPLYDERRYLESSGDKWVAYVLHGEACLDELRFSDALPDLRRAVDLEPSAPRNLVALGIAYDAIGEFGSARKTWAVARKAYFQAYPWAKGSNLVDPIGLEQDVLAGRSSYALAKLKVWVDGHPFNQAQFDDFGITGPFLQAVRVAADGQPSSGAAMISRLYAKAPFAPFAGEMRYARAITLLTLRRVKEARTELGLAARLNSSVPDDNGPYADQWSAITLLEHTQGQ